MWQNFIDQKVSNLEYVIHQLAHWFDQHLLNIIIIIFGCWLLHKFGSKAISRIMYKTVRHDLYPTEADRKKRIKTLDNLISAVVQIATWLLAIFMIISELGINTAPLLASAGVFGLTIGFGAQSLIKDFVTGIFIITENQYRIGDVVEIGTVKGIVEAITIRTTIIRSLDGDLHHVPNGTITVTTNKTMDYGSINEDITVARDTDLRELEHIINHVGEEITAIPELKGMVSEAPHFSQVKGFDASGVVVKILGETTAGDAWTVKSELYKRLIKAFERHNIEVPYQQVTVNQTKAKT